MPQPDYDEDPGRWNAWRPKSDVHEMIAPEIRGPVLDVGCGDGHLAHVLADVVSWIGVDRSWTMLANNPFRPVVQADMRALPFRNGGFSAVTHLWCLYHVDSPTAAIGEARRVLKPGGKYFACTNARTSDPELRWEGYPTSSFDAEDAFAIVREVFPGAEEERWDAKLYSLETRDEVERYCRHHFMPLERADDVEVPIWLTKRGVLIRATKE